MPRIRCLGDRYEGCSIREVMQFNRPRRRGHQRQVYDLRDVRGRLRLARLVSGKTVHWSAKLIGVSLRSMHQKLSGEHGITTDEISLLANAYQSSPRWVLAGGEPPPGIAAALAKTGAVAYIDNDGNEHARRELTELEAIMGPYLSNEARARDKTGPAGDWRYVTLE